jgi:P27 family predicted phage terminase small subunit
MPKGGHNRKPKQLKVIQGTFRKDRNPKNEPQPDRLTEIPKPPSYIGKYGKQLWNTHISELIEKGIVTTLDLSTFASCCIAWHMVRSCHDTIFRPLDPVTGKRVKRSLDEYLEGRNSQTQTELTNMHKFLDQYHRYMAGFGLEPVARNKIDLLENPVERDPMEELFEDDM